MMIKVSLSSLLLVLFLLTVSVQQSKAKPGELKSQELQPRSNNCSDLYEIDCKDWAAYGDCTSKIFADQMKRECPATCGYCKDTTPQCKCGQANLSSNRIVNGKATTKNKYPWQAYLVNCGGTIISNKEILTAAHCTEGIPARFLSVWVGEHDLDQRGDGEKRVQICSKTEHPNYDPRTLDYDFAILTVCDGDEIEFSREVSPACLPEFEEKDTGFDENVDTIASGWGYTSGITKENPTLLQELKMQTMDCKPYYWYSTDRMLCGQVDEKSICSGDSGGPWVTEVEGNYILTGVSSWVPVIYNNICVPGGIVGAAKVVDQLDWIKSNMEGATCPRA